MHYYIPIAPMVLTYLRSTSKVKYKVLSKSHVGDEKHLFQISNSLSWDKHKILDVGKNCLKSATISKAILYPSQGMTGKGFEQHKVRFPFAVHLFC